MEEPKKTIEVATPVCPFISCLRVNISELTEMFITRGTTSQRLGSISFSFDVQS